MIAVAALLLAGHLRGTAEDNKLRGMRPYTVGQQQQHAEALIDGLNSRNISNVNLFHTDDDEAARARSRIARNIAAAMPNVRCHYTLDSVRDRGEQGRQAVGWLGSEGSGVRTYRFDMLVTEVCPHTDPIPLVIGVIAVPSGMGGNWADAALVVEQ